MKTSVVSPVTPESRPPNTPAIHIGFSASQIIRSLSSRVCSTPSRVVNFVPEGHVRTTILPPATRLRSKQWSGCPRPRSTKLVMSTILLMGRCPAAASRLRNHSGDSATLTPRTVTPLYRGQPCLSSTSTGVAPSERSGAKSASSRRRSSGIRAWGSVS